MASFDPDAPALAGSGIYGLHHSADEARVILIPVPWDPTTSYRSGAARGPEAILRASHQVDLYDIETGEPFAAGIHMLDDLGDVRAMGQYARQAANHVIEAGGVIDNQFLEEAVTSVNDHGADLNRWVHTEVERWLDAGKLVGVVGGDHSVSFGAIQSLAARHPGLGILHIDAHADLRKAFESFTWSHASIMYNVMTEIPDVARLVQVGIRDVGQAEHAFIRDAGRRIVTHFEPELAALRFSGETFSDQTARIVEALPRDVYISFDIDGLDPAYCPHTGTPVPGGLSFAQACFLLRTLGESGRRIVGFDLTEVAPEPVYTDEPVQTHMLDEWDGNVGARILYKMIGWALKSRS